jgi:peptidyl-prolyl cis-trans isomerase B (cyclophilin B)
VDAVDDKITNAPQENTTEPITIIGFVLAFLFWPAGLVLSIIGLRRTPPGRSGRGLAIAGITISAVGAFAALVVGIVIAVSWVQVNNNNTRARASSTVGVTGGSSPTAPSAQPAPASANLVAGCVTPPAIPNDKRTRTLPDKKIAAGKTFIATIMTNCGVIKVELDGTKAPQTVASFLGLAESGYWADSPCHRLTPTGIFVLQCGDPTGSGQGTPGYGFGVENPPANSIFPPGTLAMARTNDPKSNGGQFFIVYKQTELKDPVGYSIFGRITSGMDIVDKIAAAGAAQPDANQNTAPLQPISILTVNVTEKKA